jgi:hypothetical protein
MSLFSWLRNRTSNPPARAPSPRRRASRGFRPRLESLEGRALPTAFFAATAADLIADINAANKVGGANSITLTAPTTAPYVLTAVNNSTDGATGTPVISGGSVERKLVTAADNLTIFGNADTIERSTTSGTPDFRLFDVASGSSLTLELVTIENGVAQGSGTAAEGGAIHNQGTLTLMSAAIQDNTAQGANGADGLKFSGKSLKDPTIIQGQAGADAAGGAVWSSGSVSLEGKTDLYRNQALGGKGGAGGVFSSAVDVAGSGGAGGGGFGGGLYLAGGSVNGAAATLTDNTAAGGAGGDAFVWYGGGSWSATNTVGGLGGVGAGGGLYAAAGTLNVTGATVQSNQALGGTGGGATLFLECAGNGGAAYGGAIDIAAATATLATSGSLANVAQGGTGGDGYNQPGGSGGNAFGGGLYAGAGTVALTNDTATGNDAVGGSIGPYVGADDPTAGLLPPAPNYGTGAGGGIEIASAAAVSLDLFTVNNTNNNQIFTSYLEWVVSNIDGNYLLVA